MGDQENLPVPGPTTVQQDTLAAALGLLLPLGGGLLVLWGYAWLGWFGAIVGGAGVAWWGFWWYGKHKTLFPKDLRGGQVGGLAVLTAVFGLFFFLALAP
ncbi:hypothetical protein ABZ805_01525 [Saccharopolyspora sp. NPDC047091]|uniref:hypothetical protein n=1 Tax=Saccharopolyspora sp. NPDC047091 TaxID=3155924 RepID=UPI0033C310CE